MLEAIKKLSKSDNVLETNFSAQAIEMSQHERAATPPASQDGGFEQSMADVVENIEE